MRSPINEHGVTGRETQMKKSDALLQVVSIASEQYGIPYSSPPLGPIRKATAGIRPRPTMKRGYLLSRVKREFPLISPSIVS